MTRKPTHPRHGGPDNGVRRGSPSATDPVAGSAAPARPSQGTDTPKRPRTPVRGAPAEAAGDADRIAKVMARAGLCSRRDAEEWIAAGRVAVNGGTLSSPAVTVTARDRITVDGKPLPRRERTRLFLYHKPVGLVSTSADPQGRATVFDALPKDLPRLMSIGRLDIGTEGLLLLTNDGGLARVLELPDTGWVRRYRVRAHGRVTQADLDTLRDGITVDGVHYGPIEATLDREQGANIWISFAIREGKNREVRNVLAHLDLQVNRLIRVEFGPFGLGELAEGVVEEVETKNLRAQLGDRIVDQADCDFTGPAAEREAPSREQRRQERQDLRRELRRVVSDRIRPRQEGVDDRVGERVPARRDGDAARAPRKSRHDVADTSEQPPGRPRRGHAWRQDDAPLRRTYRGSRRDDLKIADDERPDRRAGLLTDQKGRRVLVERFGTRKEKPRPANAAVRARSSRSQPPRDRASGPRPSRPRSAGERSDAPHPDERRDFAPRVRGPRADRPEKSEPRQFEPRVRGPRADRSAKSEPRKSGPGSDRPRAGGRDKFEPRSERPRTSRSSDSEASKSGQRPPRSSSPRAERPDASRPRSPGSRPPERRPSGPRKGGPPSSPSRPSGPRPPRAR